MTSARSEHARQSHTTLYIQAWGGDTQEYIVMRIAYGVRSRIARLWLFFIGTSFREWRARGVRALLVPTAALACAGCGHEMAEAEAPRSRQQARIALAQPALLKPQPAPDCDYKAVATDPKGDGAAEAARVKLDYERQCYKHAEMIARERLVKLQTAMKRAAYEKEHASAASGRIAR